MIFTKKIGMSGNIMKTWKMNAYIALTVFIVFFVGCCGGVENPLYGLILGALFGGFSIRSYRKWESREK